MIFQPVINGWVILTISALLFGFVLYSVYFNRTNKPVMWSWVRRSFIILLLPVLAFRPGIGAVEEVDVYTNQFDLYFVVDTTNSMAAEDWEPGTEETRLDQVKRDIDAIIQHYPGARYSLIGFDSEASVRAPLTHDASAVMSAVTVLNVEVSKYSTGSSISVANMLLEKTLKENVELKPDRERLVFFFSDGEQTVEKEPDSFELVKPYITTGEVYGYGTEEGGKMKRNDGYLITSKEDIYIKDTTVTPETEALSMVDEENLQNVANQLGVKYQYRVPGEPIEFPDVSEAKLDTSAVTAMKITSDFTWVVALPILMLVTIEMIILLVRFRKITHQQEVLHNG